MQLPKLCAFTKRVFSKNFEAIEEIDVLNWRSNDWQEIKDYIDFIGQKPQLGHFVPCDTDGKFIPEPISLEEFFPKCDSDNPTRDYFILYGKELENYRLAKSRMIFSGFEYSNHGDFKSVTNGIFHLRFKDGVPYCASYFKTIENLIGEEIMVSDWVIKKFNL